MLIMQKLFYSLKSCHVIKTLILAHHSWLQYTTIIQHFHTEEYNKKPLKYNCTKNVHNNVDVKNIV